MRSTRTAVAFAATLTGALFVSACGSSTSTPTASSTTSTTVPSTETSPVGSGDATGTKDVSLKGVCPDTVVLQTDWNPESEHGGAYELLGDSPKIDAGRKTVTGELVAQGQDTGVKFQVRAGGPAIGFQTVTSQMYVDDKITLGYVATDEQTQLSDKNPTTAVLAPLTKSPQMIMWDPTVHPDFKTIADIGKTDTKVRYFNGAAYMEYLIGSGILKRSQVDGGYDGTPANYVASNGKETQQGFASAEPYIYEHEVKAWDKPVAYQLISDAGYDFYQSQIGVRTGDLAKLTPCLTKLVPIMQQAQIDFVKSPDKANSLILDLVKKYNTGWQYSAGVATFSVEQMLKLGLVANAADGSFGSIDEARVQKIIDVSTPIFVKEKTPPKTGLKAVDIVTNQFIDKNIKLS